MDSHEELIDLADRYWDSVLEAAPSDATLLGDRRFDDRIEDYSEAADDRLLATWQGLLAAVNALDTAGLPESDRITHSLLRGIRWRACTRDC